MQAAPQTSETPSRQRACPKRRELARILGISEDEAGDETLSGRLGLILKLQSARNAEIARGRAGSWLYDPNRHLNLCALLRAEYESLTAFLSERKPVVPEHTEMTYERGEAAL